jgi:PAS domain S-box-containing protein
MALALRQLRDTAVAPIFGFDSDGNVNEWNRRTQEITGYSQVIRRKKRFMSL